MVLTAGESVEVEGVKYIIKGIIGEGGAGNVYLVAKGSEKSNDNYALKEIFNYNNPIVKELVH